jgi:ABC-type antimicrobial peptide transport system permease subunit
VISYLVTQRTQEFGIRMALGARRLDIVFLVIGQEIRLVMFGVMIGLAATFGLTCVMQSLLFEVSPTDPTDILIDLYFVWWCGCARLLDSCKTSGKSRSDDRIEVRMSDQHK